VIHVPVSSDFDEHSESWFLSLRILLSIMDRGSCHTSDYVEHSESFRLIPSRYKVFCSLAN